jgi:hypothetical protein
VTVDLPALLAREAVRDLVARYAHGADRGRSGEVAALFADDGTLELPDGRVLTGPAAIRGFLDETAARVQSAGSTAGPLRHHVSSHRVVVDGADTATGYAYFLVVSARGPDHWGRYADRYVRTAAGAWRFASRRVRLDGRAPGATA